MAQPLLCASAGRADTAQRRQLAVADTVGRHGTSAHYHCALVYDPHRRDGRTGHSLLYRQSHRDGKSCPYSLAGAGSPCHAVAHPHELAAAAHPMGHQPLPAPSIYSGCRFALVAPVALATAFHSWPTLLWSQHLAYLFIPLGLLALGALAAGLPISLSLASHLLSAGCMGP